MDKLVERAAAGLNTVVEFACTDVLDINCFAVRLLVSHDEKIEPLADEDPFEPVIVVDPAGQGDALLESSCPYCLSTVVPNSDGLGPIVTRDWRCIVQNVLIFAKSIVNYVV